MDEGQNGFSSISNENRRENYYNSIEQDPSESAPLLERRPPQRGAKIVYASFLLLGLGMLLPWNFYITAESYWQFKFRNTSEPVDDWGKRETRLQKLYDPLQVSLSQITNFLFLFINALFSHLFSQKLRVLTSLIIMIVLFSITTSFTRVDTDSWQMGLFLLTMFIIVLMNASGAIFQGGLFGIAGMFPQRFINAVGVGQALGGVLASVARILSLYFGVDDVTSAFIYFLIAVAFMCLTLFAYLYVSSTTFFKFYSSNLVLPENVEESPTKRNESFGELINEHVRIFKKIWPLGLSVCFVFLVTLSVFPVVCVKILSSYQNKTWADKYFQPVVTFLLFNVTDYLGRTTAELVLWPGRSSRILHLLSGLRVISIPLLLLCNHDPQSPIPSVFVNDAWYIVFMIAFGFSNGYVCSLCMMYAPRMVLENEAEKAGAMMAAMIGLGLLLASICSFGFALIS